MPRTGKWKNAPKHKQDEFLLLNPKHEAFAFLMVAPKDDGTLRTAKEAYQEVFPTANAKTCATHGALLAKKPAVIRYINALREEWRKAIGIRPERIIANVAVMAFDEANSKRDRIAAHTLLIKLLGLGQEKVDVTSGGRPISLDPDERAREFMALLDAARARAGSPTPESGE